MNIDPKKQTKKENYKLLIGSVLPRPIAFVTSKSPDGVVNAAPFSFYNVVSSDPPMLGINCGRNPDNTMKHTAYNATQTGEFAVHVVTTNNVHKVNDCSIDFPADMSEVEQVGLTLKDSQKISVPGIQESAIRMECRLSQHLPLGGTQDKPSADFLIGEIVWFDIDDNLYSDGKIDTEALDPVGRLAGTTFGKLGEMFSLPRRKFNEISKQ